MRKPERKSPLRERPLRTAGESLEDQIEQLWVDEFFKWVLVRYYPPGVCACCVDPLGYEDPNRSLVLFHRGLVGICLQCFPAP